MLNIKLTSRSSLIVIGLLIFFVPFFTYLSPENLRQLSKSDVLEILLSLIIILTVIFISSFSVEMLMKRFFKKKIMLFPLLCFVFYLNFSYMPFAEVLQEFVYPKFGYIGAPVFIFFEIFCLAVIAFGAKFNNFSIRTILIFSIFMLINALIPLVGYLAENIGKNPTITYEIKSSPLTQEEVLIKRNVYYIILDGMMAIEAAEQNNLATKKEVLDNLSSSGLKYIDKSQSSYNDTRMTLASIMLLDYHLKPSSPNYVDASNFSFPHMMHKKQNELPLIPYLQKANSSFYWTGNNWTGCNFEKWSCMEAKNNISSRASFKFYSSTPLSKIYKRINKNNNQFAIDSFLEYIDKNGVPKTPFFAFIHHLSPHTPFLVTNECEPTNYINQDFEGYKASYQCALKTVKIFMQKINNIDPEAIVVFQADHGWNLDLELTDKEKDRSRGKIFNAIKAPEICFDKYGLPKTNVNTIRFTLNCAYGFKLPYRKDIHYKTDSWGSVVEKIIYE
jgi:hypothetical protein